MKGASSQLINDGKRLHLQHGPIDLIVDADGENRQRAYAVAKDCFRTILGDLVDELPALRSVTDHSVCQLHGVVAERMWSAVSSFPVSVFTTPMIAVAGSVADEVLQCITRELELPRVSVNNGGDIAFSLEPGQSYEIGIVANPVTGDMLGSVTLTAEDGVGGIATSGWHGRSHSLGIADAVTVLARDAAMADTAATIVANAVTLAECDSIVRTPANQIQPDSDLGSAAVTTQVGPLTSTQIDMALDSGLAVADDLCERGLIAGACLCLQQVHRTTVRGQFHGLR